MGEQVPTEVAATTISGMITKTTIQVSKLQRCPPLKIFVVFAIVILHEQEQIDLKFPWVQKQQDARCHLIKKFSSY